MASGFSNFNKFYGIVGSALLGWILTSKSMGWYNVFQVLKIFATITTISVFLFYAGAWQTSFSAGRSSFLGQQVNIMGNLLVIGYASLWFLRVDRKQNKRSTKYYDLILLLYVFPILATVSRTSIFCFLLISVIFFFNNAKKLVVIVIFVGLIFGPLIYGVVSKLEAVKKVEERSEALDQDPRFILANRAYEYVLDNPFGGGFQLYNNLEAYADIGIYIGKDGSKSVHAIHNSFLDLAVFGGIPLSIIYFLILLNIPIVGLKYYFNQDLKLKNIGAFLVSGSVILFMYSYMSHAFAQKHSWLFLGVCYSFIFLGEIHLFKIKKELELRNKASLSTNLKNLK